MSQMDFMKKDECILLDEKDTVTGSANKYDAHVFNAEQPTGLLHRAFSVFLFDSKGRLLLQQRAKSKITFPLVWTNTCCSHPLHGYEPTEVDTPADVASGETPGAKRAAVRKLKHELGIEAHELPVEKFKFLTRLHYWAADTITHGPSAQWGEHEIDYVLFIQAKVTVKPNPEEVEDYKYVTQAELAAMMDPKKNPDLLWSPWFKLITKELLLGTSNPEYASLPLSDGWLTPSDVLCVLDDIYTYDVLTEGGGEEGGALLLFEAAVWVARSSGSRWETHEALLLARGAPVNASALPPPRPGSGRGGVPRGGGRRSWMARARSRGGGGRGRRSDRKQRPAARGLPPEAAEAALARVGERSVPERRPPAKAAEAGPRREQDAPRTWWASFWG